MAYLNSLTPDQLKQLDAFYANASSGEQSITLNGETYGTVGTGGGMTEGGYTPYTPDSLIEYDPSKMAPGDAYYLINPTTGASTGTAAWQQGDDHGLGALAVVLAAVGGEALGALGDSATAASSLGAEVDPMVYGGSGAGTWGAAGDVAGSTVGGVGSEVDPMAYGGGSAATYGAGDVPGAGAYDYVNGSDLQSDLADQTGIAPPGAVNGGVSVIPPPGGIPTTTVTPPPGGPGTTPPPGGPPGGGPGGGSGGGAGGGGLGGLGGLLGGLGSLLSGKDGMDLAKQILKQSDPFAPYRDMYAQKLNALWADPSSITHMPGYESGMTAVERSLASQGYTGSGNMMAGLQEYGGGFFDKTLSQLETLSGANTNPGNGALGAAQLMSAAQGSMGYGASNILNSLLGSGGGAAGGLGGLLNNLFGGGGSGSGSGAGTGGSGGGTGGTGGGDPGLGGGGGIIPEGWGG